MNAIIINVDAGCLTQSIREISKEQNESGTEYLVVSEEGQLLESTMKLDDQEEQLLLEKVAQVLRDMEQGDELNIELSGVNYLITCNNNNSNQWYLFSLTPREAVFSDVIQTSLLGLVIVVLILCLASVLLFFLSKRLYQPIHNITSMVAKQSPAFLPPLADGKDEFQFLSSVFQSIQKQNAQFAKFKAETADSARQDFVNTMLTGNSILSLDSMKKKLEMLNLSYLLDSTLCMCLLKIDRYDDFYTSNNQKERWALRYAIVNIVSEVSNQYFQCEIFNRNSDKFVLLVTCEETEEYEALQGRLEEMLQDIQKQIHHISLTLSVAYSTVFRGIDHLRSIYSNLEDMIHLKMQFGHECIITPRMFDEVNLDSFPRHPLEKQLIEQVCTGDDGDAAATYEQIVKPLFDYSYDEITAYVMHLAYALCTATQFKNPYIRQGAAERYRKFMMQMGKCEVFTDVREFLGRYIADLAVMVKKLADNPDLSTNQAIVQRMCLLIENNYQKKDLCLNVIAEKMNLSSNYVGHVFKEVQKMSVSRYIQEFRMEKVGFYLQNTNLSVDKIIDKVGLEKSSYFYTCFKKHFGMTLSEYKLKIKPIQGEDGHGGRQK